MDRQARHAARQGHAPLNIHERSDLQPAQVVAVVSAPILDGSGQTQRSTAGRRYEDTRGKGKGKSGCGSSQVTTLL